MEDSGIVCGDMGGKRDWKTVVQRFSRCLGTAGDGMVEAESMEAEAGVLKLFITRRGAVWYS